jgi:hypothetical protein
MRNPYLAAPDGKVQVLGASNPPVYPASRLQKRYHNFQQSGRYTSACSGMIYRDSLLFPKPRATNRIRTEGSELHGKTNVRPQCPRLFRQ